MGKRKSPGYFKDAIAMLTEGVGEKWAKGLAAGTVYTKENFEEAPDLVFWFRVIAAVVLGVIWGTVPLTGLPAILAYAAVSSALAYSYATRFVRIREDDFGGYIGLLKEGLKASTAVFFLVWIATYSTMTR